MNAGALAFAYTRVRAARGRLVGAETLLRLRLADSPASRASALLEAGLGDGTALGAQRALFARLGADYTRVLRSLPGDLACFEALRGRHEVENLKLSWRAVTRGHPAARWTPWWRPLGVLALEDFRLVHSVGDLVERCARTPYAAIAETLARAHGQAPLAGELALDRFATQRILDAARALGRRDADLAELLLELVRERDAALFARAAEYQSLLALDGEPDPEAGARRRRACERSFLRGPFSRAAAAGLLLLEEDRLDEVVARAEAV